MSSVIAGVLSAAGAIADSITGTSAASKVVAAANAAFLNSDGTSIGALTNARVYLNSGDLLGRVEKIDGLGLPKFRTSEYKAVGMHSNVNLPAGLEQPELKISWNGLYGDLGPYLHNPMAVIRFQIIGSHEFFNNRGLAKTSRVVIQVHGMVKESSAPSIENGSPAKMETTFNVTYSKATVDDVEWYEYDIFNNIYKCGSVSVFDSVSL